MLINFYCKNKETAILNLYIINSSTGRILLNKYVSNVDFDYPINLVVDENGVFVTYYNKNVFFTLRLIILFL